VALTLSFAFAFVSAGRVHPSSWKRVKKYAIRTRDRHTRARDGIERTRDAIEKWCEREKT